MSNNQVETGKGSRFAEFRLFIFLTAILIPAITVALVGAMGFGIWMYQILTGPPAG